MSSSVFKEYPSSLTGDGETKLNSNLVVFINKNGSVSVDPNALQDLLVNDANTNTSVSVIRVSSPTPSLQQEFDEEDELEKELAKMNTYSINKNMKNENEKGKEYRDGGLDDDYNVDDDDDDVDEDDDDDDDVDGKNDDNIHDYSDDPEDTDDGKDNEDIDDQEVDKDKDANKVENKKRKQKLAKLKKKIFEKVPHVSLTVEHFYSPIEAKQLASDILSIAGITNPLQLSIDFDFQRYVIANDHCYTPLTSPSQRHPIDGGSWQSSTTSSPKLTTKTSYLLSKTNQKSNNTKITKRKTSAKTLKTVSTFDETTNIATDTEDGDVSAAVAVDSADESLEDVESYTSDESYESPSESENDRDSDLDFSVNDRTSKVCKFNRNRNLRQKQQVATAATICAKQNSFSKFKKRQSALIEGVCPIEDEGTNKKTNKLPAINNKSQKKLLNQSQKNISSSPLSSTLKLTKSAPLLIPSTINMSIKQTNKTGVSRISNRSITGSPEMISSTTKTTPVVSAPIVSPPTQPSAKLIVGNGTQQKIILSKVITPSQKSKLNYIQHLVPILSISSGPPVPALAPISIDTKQIKSIGTPTTSQQQQASGKKDKKPLGHMEALFSDMTSLFSTPDIIKKVGSGKNNLMTSTSNQQSFQSSNHLTPSSTMTIPMNKCYFMPLTPQSQRNRNLPSQISIRTHQSNNTTSHDVTQSSNRIFATEQDKEMDLIDSIVQKELKDTSPPPQQMILKKPSSMNTMIPNIVKMLEHPVDSPIILTSQNQLINSLPSANNSTSSIPFHSVAPITNDTQLLDDPSDLLEEFAVEPGTDDGLTEDLLQHVAKLVEDKNLQEVIDKQVLGVTGSNNHIVSVTTTTTKLNKSSIMTTPLRSDYTNHLITNTPTTSLNILTKKLISTPTPPITSSSTPTAITTPTPFTSVQSAAKKEGIKIIRSDGRVITLPPIEAPTTRGAKRRAQNQPNQDISGTPKRSSSVGSKSEATPITNNSATSGINHNIPKITKEVVTSTAKERRQSVQSVRKSVDQQTPKSKQQKTTSTPSSLISIETGGTLATGDIDEFNDDDNDDDGSDGSYNSEDDPFRLWCICRQPHNNRFMICCDKCEDWFHGKCVNVTKAMGVEMEERGVEWVCPACVKKQPSQLQEMFKKTIEQQAVKNREENIYSCDASSPLTLSCIVCNRPARPSSIYCSDDCIRKHALTTTVNTSTATSSGTITSIPQIVSATSSSLSISSETGLAASNTTCIDQNRQTSIISNQSNIGEITKKSLPTFSLNQNSKISPSGGGVVGKNTSRVDVFEPKTGRCLTGNSAPTIENLKRWLQEHPTFEIVYPGSAQAMAIKAKKQQLKNLAKAMEQDEQQNKLSTAIQQSTKIQTMLKIGPSKRIVLVNPQKSPTLSSSPNTSNLKNSTNPPKLIAVTQPQNVTTLQKSQIGTPQIKTTNNIANSTKNKKRTSGEQSSAASATVSTEKQQQNRSGHHNNVEPIRVTVQKTLREQLTIRMAEQEPKSAKLTPNEIDKFALDTEREIYYMFSKDTGTKYRTKYRSLMFNIKDRKNKTLFRKICDKSCLPKQLVRMSAAELASQELAQWRENENKHQLEMIKKSELDLLACAKNYVLKTHKGEEVIESRRIDQVQLDPSISVEDVVSVLNNSTVSSTTVEQQIITQSNQSPVPLIKDTRIDSRFEKYLTTTDNVSAIKSATPPLDKKKSSSSLSTLSSSHKRSRSRSKDCDGKNSSTLSASSSKHKRRRSRDRSEDRSKKEAKQQKDKNKKLSTDSIASDASCKKDFLSLEKQTKKSLDSTAMKSKSTTTKEPPKPKKEDNFNLIDKILEAQSTIDRILRPDETESTKQIENNKSSVKSTPPPSCGPTKTITDIISINKSLSMESSDQEPTSTVTIPTPPTITDTSSNTLVIIPNKLTTTTNTIKKTCIDSNNEINLTLWSGSIVMVDVATFQIHFNALSGDCSTIINELPIELDVVGRIQPDTVWDYIGKIKKSFNKEILLLQFFAEGEDDTEAYYTLYRYLSTRKRFGVIKTKSSLIKDFYILPLASHKSLPSVLGSVDRIEFESNRQDILLGIIVKNVATTLAKRVISAPSISVSMAKVARIEKPTPLVVSNLSKSKISTVIAEDRYTPPLSQKIPLITTMSLHESPVDTQILDNALEDGDEPYSPGGSDEEIPILSTIMKTTAPIQIVSINPEQDEIERKMAELTRQIEAQKMVIAGMLQTENNQQLTSVDGINEPYSPTSLLDTTNPLDKASTSSATPKTTPIPGVLSNIAIPSNLQEILNSINKATTASTTIKSSTKQSDLAALTNTPQAPPVPLISHLILDSDDDNDEEEEEYTPTICGKILSTAYGYQPLSSAAIINPTDGADNRSTLDYIPSKTLILSTSMKNNQQSKLAQLTDEELLRMVPDDDLLVYPSSSSSAHYHSHYKLQQQQQQKIQQIEQNLTTGKYNSQLHNLPPPPGLEDDCLNKKK